MYPYTKELTLDEALNTLLNAKCQSYEKDGKVFLTPLDYATHILKQAAPPEGYGYAAYDEPERYKGLHKLDLYLSGWVGDNIDFDGDWNGWHYYAFRLTDLARVEAISEMETTVTDWEAKYKELEGQSRQIKEEVYELTDRLLDAQNCIAVQEREITKLKNYIIKQLLNK